MDAVAARRCGTRAPWRRVYEFDDERRVRRRRLRRPSRSTTVYPTSSTTTSFDDEFDDFVRRRLRRFDDVRPTTRLRRPRALPGGHRPVTPALRRPRRPLPTTTADDDRRPTRPTTTTTDDDHDHDRRRPRRPRTTTTTTRRRPTTDVGRRRRPGPAGDVPRRARGCGSGTGGAAGRRPGRRAVRDAPTAARRGPALGADAGDRPRTAAFVQDPRRPDTFWIAGAERRLPDRRRRRHVHRARATSPTCGRSASHVADVGDDRCSPSPATPSTLHRSTTAARRGRTVTLPAGVGAVGHPLVVLDDATALLGTSTGVYRTADGGADLDAGRRTSAASSVRRCGPADGDDLVAARPAARRDPQHRRRRDVDGRRRAPADADRQPRPAADGRLLTVGADGAGRAPPTAGDVDARSVRRCRSSRRPASRTRRRPRRRSSGTGPAAPTRVMRLADRDR